MKDLISWYNRNRKKIFLLLTSAVILGAIFYRLFQISIENRENTTNDTVQTPTIDTNTFNSISLQTQKSAISRENITNTQKEISVIDNFMSYCNSKELDKAYSLISDDCKKELYPKLKDFQNGYYKTYFNGQSKLIKTENWINGIYKIDIGENALATGRYSSSSNLQDYITLTKDNQGNTKLNINGYISKTTYNLSQTQDNVTVKLLEKNIYMDCEYYTFEVTNNNIHNVIALADKKYPSTIYITDANGFKYESCINTYAQEELNVYPKQKKNIKIKFLNKYSSSRNIKSLTLSQVVLSFIITQASDTEDDCISMNFDL